MNLHLASINPVNGIAVIATLVTTLPSAAGLVPDRSVRRDFRPGLSPAFRGSAVTKPMATAFVSFQRGTPSRLCCVYWVRLTSRSGDLTLFKGNPFSGGRALCLSEGSAPLKPCTYGYLLFLYYQELAQNVLYVDVETCFFSPKYHHEGTSLTPPPHCQNRSESGTPSTPVLA